MTEDRMRSASDAEERSGAILPRAPLFDFDKGDLVTDGAGRVTIADGRTAWLLKCIKLLLTEKGTCLAYSDNTGIDLNWAREQSSRKAQEQALIGAISDALSCDEYARTLRAGQFTFTWEGDTLEVAFALTGVGGYHGRAQVKVEL